MVQTVAIERVAHTGIRVRDLHRALAFYRVLGFTLSRRAEGDDVAIIRNPQGVEINLIFNANAGDPATNILMDVPEKYPGYTHVALSVASIPAIVAGDARVAAISAASILAKTSRDAMMEALDACYPGYELAVHKGYGTPEHLEALRRLGPTPLHRNSFAPVRESRCWSTGATQTPLPL